MVSGVFNNSAFAVGLTKCLAVNFVVTQADLAAELTTKTPTFPKPFKTDEPSETFKAVFDWAETATLENNAIAAAKSARARKLFIMKILEEAEGPLE